MALTTMSIIRQRIHLFYANYDARTFRKEKIKNKRGLQKELGLSQDDKKFMIGIVSRLTDQKGFDLIDYVDRRNLCRRYTACGTWYRRRKV